MLKLKRLKISNVGRFVGEHEIDFSSRSQTLQIDAKNLNTGGSSGSGKSTLFNSLEYLLGMNSIPATVLQSRLTKDPLQVVGEFDYNGKPLEIKRSKSGGLTISVDGIECASGDVKVAEEKLDVILGIDRDLLRKMMHKRQKEGGFFLNLTPKKCHEFLADALNLKTWSSRLEKSESDHKKYKQDTETFKAVLEVSSKSLESAKMSLQGLVEPKKLDFTKDTILIVEENLQKANQELELAQKELNSELLSIVSPKPPELVDKAILKDLQSRLDQLRAEDRAEKENSLAKLMVAQKSHKEIEQRFESVKRLAESVPALEKDLELIKSKIIKIRSNECPTCGQNWTKHESQLNSMISEAKSIMGNIEKASAAKNELPSLDVQLKESLLYVDELRKMTSQESPVFSSIRDLEAEISSERDRLVEEDRNRCSNYESARILYEKQKKDTETKFAKKLEVLSFNVQQNKDLLFKMKTELSFYTRSVSDYNTNKQNLESSVKKFEDQYSEAAKNLANAEKMTEVSGLAVKVIKGYMNSLFEDALAYIASKATEILSRIPNMATASIYFEGFKETKSGVVKEEVNAILTMDGEINIPVNSMSGGERTAIDLAVDLAVIDFIEARAGKGIDIFVLDEPFDGLDSVCREQCLEILKNQISSKRIVIVDHSNETKEMVDDRIIVVRSGQESSIQSAV